MLTSLLASLAMRWAIARHGVTRAIASNLAPALAVAAVAVALLAGLWWLRADGAADAAARCEAGWASALGNARAEAERAHAARNEAVRRMTEAELLAMADRLSTERERAASLEAALAALSSDRQPVAAACGNPVVIPRTIVKEMRR